MAWKSLKNTEQGGERNRRCAVFLVIGFLISIVSPGWAAVEVTKTHSFVESTDKEKVFDDWFTKLLKDKLDTTYQNLQIVVHACMSGGFAFEPKSGINPLAGNWSASTPRDQVYKVSVSRKKPDRTSAPSGLKIGDWFYHGWKAQWIKKLKENAAATAKQLFEYATANDIHRPGPAVPTRRWPTIVPQFEFGGTGDGSKINDGRMSNHALLWSPDSDTAPDKSDLMTELYSRLIAAGYTNDTIDYAFDTNAGENVNGRPVDRNATKEQLSKMVTKLKEALEAHPGDEKAFIWLNAHGNTEKRKAEKQSSPVPGNRRQGKIIVPDGSVRLELDAPFVQSFFEDTGTDDPEVQRDGFPTVLVTTSEEQYAGPVTVSLDGVDVGQLILLGASTGADYELEIDDTRVLELFESGTLNDLLVDVVFDFPSGDFRIATEWDFYLDDLSHYGVGLGAPPIKSTLEVVGAEIPTLSTLGTGTLMLLLSIAIASKFGRRRAEQR